MGEAALEAVLKDEPCSRALWPPGPPPDTRPGSAALLTPASAPCRSHPRARSPRSAPSPLRPWAIPPLGPGPCPITTSASVLLGEGGDAGRGGQRWRRVCRGPRGAVQALLMYRLPVSRQPQFPSLSSRSQPRAAVSTRTWGPAQCPAEARLRLHGLTRSRSFPDCVAWWRACAVTSRGLYRGGPAWCLPAVRASGPWPLASAPGGRVLLAWAAPPPPGGCLLL